LGIMVLLFYSNFDIEKLQQVSSIDIMPNQLFCESTR